MIHFYTHDPTCDYDKKTLEQIGVEASYLSRMEKGTVPISCERIYEIIHLLDCDIKEIFPLPAEVETQFNR